MGSPAPPPTVGGPLPAAGRGWPGRPASIPAQPSADHRPGRSAHLGRRRRERLGPAASPPGWVAGLHRPRVWSAMLQQRRGLTAQPAGRSAAMSTHGQRPGPPGHKKLGSHPIRRRPSCPRTGRGRRQPPRRSVGGGYDYLHAAVDDHSRLAYVEGWVTSEPQTLLLLRRAHHWFALHGVTVTRGADRQRGWLPQSLFVEALAATGVDTRHPTLSPQTNGKWSGSTDLARGVGPISGCIGPTTPRPCLVAGSTGTT